MQLFEIRCKWDKAVQACEESNYRRYRENEILGFELSGLCNKFNERLKASGVLFVSDVSDGYVSFGLCLKDKTDVERLMKLFGRTAKINIYDIEAKEVVSYNFSKMLDNAERFDFCFDKEEILDTVGLTNVVYASRHRHINYHEDLIRKKTKEELYKEIENTYATSTLGAELDRIYSTVHKKYYGHPVNYIIESDDKNVRDSITKVLTGGLFNNNRVESRRYGKLIVDPNNRLDKEYYTLLAKSNAGGIMIWDCSDICHDDDEFAYGSIDIIENVCDGIKNSIESVLNIIYLPRSNVKIKENFFENLEGITFIELKEDFSYYEESCKYLKKLAANKKVRTDKALFSKLEESEGYLTPQLNAIFNSWYSNKLKKSVFPQYSEINCVKASDIDKKAKGKAINELDEMIGISSAKNVIHNAISYYKAQKLFKEKGIQTNIPAMHMVFTGNPGTAKTTVARLVAKIFKENNIIQNGHIVECGRGNLVGKYVGWTAPTIQKKFKEAEGGVLFIDEAYSLVDDRDGLFGDEAINTIVQEMENHRKDVIVIFAGYPDKMRKFLDKNPGLRSRIAFHVNFEDYSTEELCEIATLMSTKMNMIVSDDAMDKLAKIFEQVRLESDYGNGRFVRNVLEKARMAQSNRLINMDVDKVKKKDLQTILAEDINEPVGDIAKTRTKIIGFQV